jgi:Tol biopolymer transport system component
MRSRAATATLDPAANQRGWHVPNRTGSSGLKGLGRASGTAVLVSALVLATTHLALQLPGIRVLAPFSPAGLLGYDRFLAELSPLSDDYISRVLGLDLAPEGGAGAGAPGDDEGSPQELRHRFTNDDFAHAVRPARLPFTAHTDTSGATREPGEPESCSPVGGTAWYAYRPTHPVTLVADTFGTPYATTLAVFRGTSLSSLAEVGCSRSVTGNAQVSFQAAAGQTYYFQVAGPAGGGALTFALTALGPTARVSVTSDEKQSDGYQQPIAALSSDGRYVAFTGGGHSLGNRNCGNVIDHPNLTAWCEGLWLRDRVTGTTSLLLSAAPRRPNTQDDESSQARTPDRFSYIISQAKFSADGRYISFASDDPTLVPGDRNGSFDVFVFDRVTSGVQRVSLDSLGREGQHDRATYNTVLSTVGAYGASMSADGRFVVFASSLQGHTPDDRNRAQDVFVRDRQTGRTERVSVSSDGSDLNMGATSSALQAISADGRYVVFYTLSAGVWPEPGARRCADGCYNNAYVHDRVTRRTTLLARNTRGEPGNGISHHPTISADGRFAAFTSTASNLVVEDTNGVHDVFRVELRTGRITRVSVASTGEQQQIPPYGTGDQAQHSAHHRPVINLSSDGRYTAFSSAAPNLAAGDNNNALDVFVHDSVTGSTSRLSVTETGGDADGDSFNPFLSADARTVVFVSAATNLVANDTNRANDIFVHDSPVAGRA